MGILSYTPEVGGEGAQEAQAGYVPARQPSNMHEQGILQEGGREIMDGERERAKEREIE